MRPLIVTKFNSSNDDIRSFDILYKNNIEARINLIGNGLKPKALHTSSFDAIIYCLHKNKFPQNNLRNFRYLILIRHIMRTPDNLSTCNYSGFLNYYGEWYATVKILNNVKQLQKEDLFHTVAFEK
jgi:hypothetical protein